MQEVEEEEKLCAPLFVKPRGLGDRGRETDRDRQRVKQRRDMVEEVGEGRRLQQWELISILLQGLSCAFHPVMSLHFTRSMYAFLFISLVHGNTL